MMDVELSRRAAQALSSPVFYVLTRKEKREFATAVEAAGVFDLLPEKWQKMILEAESGR